MKKTLIFIAILAVLIPSLASAQTYQQLLTENAQLKLQVLRLQVSNNALLEELQMCEDKPASKPKKEEKVAPVVNKGTLTVEAKFGGIVIKHTGFDGTKQLAKVKTPKDMLLKSEETTCTTTCVTEIVLVPTFGKGSKTRVTELDPLKKYSFVIDAYKKKYSVSIKSGESKEIF